MFSCESYACGLTGQPVLEPTAACCANGCSSSELGTSLGRTYRRAAADVVFVSTKLRSHRHEVRSSERIRSPTFFQPGMELVAFLIDVCVVRLKSAF